ncbi:hypothetical protein CDAR_503081 [Caerostris darwini]|uniref:Uncharacterized protein n=1 Tax=Caerostris darwini TaxID=1538125 RepID=A0AAV4VLR2_9ARAC|nr:hypothetical protein CDAR_503081 [Caerostris darwini]
MPFPKDFRAHLKNSRLQENQTFLAKPDATASEPEKEKEKYRQGSAETLFLRPQMPFPKDSRAHLKNPACKETKLLPNLTPRPPNRKRKKKNIARDLQKVGFCGYRCRSQRILGVRYEVLHLGFLSPC